MSENEAPSDYYPKQSRWLRALCKVIFLMLASCLPSRILFLKLWKFSLSTNHIFRFQCILLQNSLRGFWAILHI